MKDRSKSKNKEWERRRRDRLNEAFKKLAQILPNYDPAAKVPKIDVLEKAAQFIKELRLSNCRLISQQTQTDEKSKLINELQDESNKLILRVKQLTTLLKQAKIRIPLGPSLKIGKKPGKWSNQLTPENLENNTNLSTTESSTKNGGKDDLANNSQVIDKLPQNMKSSGCDIVNSQPQPIGTPLKETNTDKESSAPLSTAKPTQLPNANVSPIIKPIVQPISMPTTTTIILTACPIPNPLAQPLVTRMTIAPRILPKADETSKLQKIAILPIRKPLPPKEKKKRNRAKKVKIVPPDTSKISKATNTLPSVPSEKNSKSSDASTQMSEKVSKSSNSKEDDKSSKKKSESSNDSKKGDPEIIDLTDESVGDKQLDKVSRKNPSPSTKKKSSISKQILENKSSEKSKQNNAEKEKQSSLEKPTETIPEVSGEEAEKILEQSNIIIESENRKEKKNNEKLPSSSNKKISEDSAVLNAPNCEEINQLEDIQVPEESVEPSTSTITESITESGAIAMDITENVEPIPSSNENDKISECIARSIGLIDPPVGELMELSGDWGEAHSPKSPISPTQMFLSMFPLLPRESIVSASDNQTSTCKSSMQFSSVRSSFFIDAMLPEENSNISDSVSTNNNNSNTSSVPRNSNTNHNTNNVTNVSSNCSSNFITSTYNSLVGTTCLAVAPAPNHTPVSQRQETTHFQNLDNFISSAPAPIYHQSPAVSSSPKKSNSSSSTSNSSTHLNNFRPNGPIVSLANTSSANQIQQNIPPVSVSDSSSQYKSHNFNQYPSYMHSQPTPTQNNRHTLPPVSIQNSNANNTNVHHQTQKKNSHTQAENKTSTQSSSVSNNSTTTNSKASSVAASHVESPSVSSAQPIPRTIQQQPQMLSTDSHNIFRNANSATAMITHQGHSTIPIPVPTPTPNHHHNQHHHHHHPYQHPSFHHNSPTPSRTTRESTKSQSYPHNPHSYSGENSSIQPQPISQTNTTNQKQQKSQIFRPGLTDFNMSARIHTHQETPTHQHTQNYSSNEPNQNNSQPKSYAPTSAAVTYSTSNNNNLNLGHQNQNYPPISTMQPQQPNLQTNINQTQNQSKSHSHSASNTNASKHQRHYSQSSEITGNSYSVRPLLQHQPQNDTQQQSHVPQNQNHSSSTKSQSQSQQQPSQPHSHRSSTQNQHQQHHSSRNQPSKGINSSHSSNNTQNSNSSSISSRNPPENSFHLDFSPVIPIPGPILAQPVPPSLSQATTNRNRNSTSAAVPNSLQIPPSIAPPPTPIPDFTPSAVMNFNQYHHHDPTIPPNYLPVRHPPPPTPTPSRATPFYLQEVHTSEPLPILGHPPINNLNANPNQTQTNSNKNNFNPPPPPVYSHSAHHNKNYFLDHSQGHSLYQHSLTNVPPQPHIQVDAPQPPPPVIAPPPPIYAHPVHTPHVSHRHQQNCNVVGPSQHQSQAQPPNISRSQQHQQNKSNNSSNKQSNQNTNQNQAHNYPVQQPSNANNSNSCSNNQQRGNQNTSGNTNSTNNAIIAVPQPNNSSRPVNWMTDPPHRKPTPVNNPFSVSKLVGNSSIVANNSYCAEALIRKNPEWNDFHFTPQTPTIVHPPPQHSHTPHTFVPYQAQNEHPAYSNFPHQYSPNPSATTHFGHFDNSQQHHHHHNHLPHHATTSSVSNFNLSSIFPEINDKRSNSNNATSTNSNSNQQEGNTNNRSNYYCGKHAK